MVTNSRYKSFAELSRSECEGISYQRTVKKRRSGLAIIAPHGGGIEPGTSELACAIASSLFSYYTFDGLKRERNKLLHITSTLFDEPQCLQLINESETVVAIHGCVGYKKAIIVGGLHDELRFCVMNALVKEGFKAYLAGRDYAGTQPQNVCNRGRSGRGIQLEVSADLRRTMFKRLDREGRKITTDVFRMFVASIQKELISAAKGTGV